MHTELFSKEWLVLLAWAALSGLLNLLVSEKSRIDEWSEKRPRLAAMLHLIRGLGIDPWMLLSALSLLVKKQLPSAVKKDSDERK